MQNVVKPETGLREQGHATKHLKLNIQALLIQEY